MDGVVGDLFYCWRENVTFLSRVDIDIRLKIRSYLLWTADRHRTRQAFKSNGTIFSDLE